MLIRRLGAQSLRRRALGGISKEPTHSTTELQE